MEILFMGQWASTEALLTLLIVAIFIAFVLYDGFRYIQRVFHIFEKKPEIPKEVTIGALTVTIDSSSEATEETHEEPSWEKEDETKDNIPHSIETNATEDTSPEIKGGSTEVMQPEPVAESLEWTQVLSSQESPIEAPEEIPEMEKNIIPLELQVTWDTQSVTHQDITVEEVIPEIGWVEEIQQEEIPESLPSESLIVEKAMASTVNPEEVVAPLPLVEEDSVDTENEEEDIGVSETEPMEVNPPSIETEKPEEEQNQLPNGLQAIVNGQDIPEQFAEVTKEDSVDAIESHLEEPIQETQKIETSESQKTWAHLETLIAISNNVRTLIARGQTLEARWLIIQGLALDKNHRELNMMLAWLYEQDHHFEKAEYIYKDLAIMHPNDVEILEKLGNVLIIQRRYEIAIEMYKKILSLSGETEGTLYILSHLAKEQNLHDIAYDYARKYQKQWPNNPEILTILAQAEVALGKRKDAIQTLIKLKNLTPYNQEIADMIQKLVLEEELAGNFQPE